MASRWFRRLKLRGKSFYKSKKRNRRVLTGLTLPRQEENDATVGCGWVEQSHALRAVVTRQDDVHARAGTADRLDGRIVHLADAVGERTGRVDDALGLHVPLLIRQHVLQPGTAENFLAAGVLLLVKLLNLDMVGDSRAVTCGGEGHSQAHASVVLLTVVVNDGTAQLVTLQHGEALESVLLGQVITRLDVAIAGDEIVSFDAGPEVWNLPPSGEEFLKLSSSQNLRKTH